MAQNEKRSPLGPTLAILIILVTMLVSSISYLLYLIEHRAENRSAFITNTSVVG